MIPTIAINVMKDNVPLLVNYADGYALRKITSMGLKMTLYISAGKPWSPLPSLSSDHRHSQPHSCNASCKENGICEIETAPHSIEATFTGTHETFQYTKVCISQRTTFLELSDYRYPSRSIHKVGGRPTVPSLACTHHWFSCKAPSLRYSHRCWGYLPRGASQTQ